MKLLEVADLTISFPDKTGTEIAVSELNFAMQTGDILGIVGESGSGKSVTSLAVMGLTNPQTVIEAEKLEFDGLNLLNLSEREFQMIRGRTMSMIFQEPMSALNPLIPVGRQIEEVLETHAPEMERKPAVIAIMKEVGLPRAEELYYQLPYELSGGMLQRILIAMAMIMRPKLLIADEPTTALDVTVQAQILRLMKRLNSQYQTAILFISHDLAVIRDICKQVMVLYLGYIMEAGPVDELINRPRNPYTLGLLKSIPRPKQKDRPLYTIPGRVPPLKDRPTGCPFHTRCFKAQPRCRKELPPLVETGQFKLRCFYPVEESER